MDAIKLFVVILVMRGVDASAFSSELPPPTPIKECVDCAIIGGGPAGLAAAIALTKASPSSSIAVFEKDAFQPKGASVQISNAGWKSLQELDKDDGSSNNGNINNDSNLKLVPALQETGVPVTGVDTKPWKYRPEDTANVGSSSQLQGKRQIVKKVFSFSNLKRAAISFLVRTVIKNRIHLWHDLRMVLADHAERLYNQKQSLSSSSSSKISTPNTCTGAGTLPLLNPNCSLISIVPPSDQDNGHDHEYDEGDTHQRCFELIFQNPETGETRTIEARYLFACDGTKSAVRSILPNEPDVLLAENRSVWRGLAPNVDAGGTATFFRGTADSDTAGRSALIFPGGREAGSSWTVISDIQDGKSSTTEEAKERVLSVIETMGVSSPNYMRLKQVIEGSNVVIENKLHIRDFEDQPWEAAYDGLIYLGDAAHPVRPTGEGTALAFEDASVLRQIVTTKGLSVESLRAFEEARFLPVKTISEKIRAQAEKFYQKVPGNGD